MWTSVSPWLVAYLDELVALGVDRVEDLAGRCRLTLSDPL
jgi:hypothetical protein